MGTRLAHAISAHQANRLFYNAWPAEHGGITVIGNMGSGVQPANISQGWVLHIDSLNRLQWQHRFPDVTGLSQRNVTLYNGWALAGGGALVSGIQLAPGYANQVTGFYQAVIRPVNNAVITRVCGHYRSQKSVLAKWAKARKQEAVFS